MNLRPYQTESVNKCIEFLTYSTDPCLLALATGAGKSHIISELVSKFKQLAPTKKVLCIQPSKELTIQNHAKSIIPASIFSASIHKDTTHDVIYATPRSIKDSLNYFEFSCIIIDEAHLINTSIVKIVDKLKIKNDILRVVGLSATPYKLSSGYIYQLDPKENLINQDGYFKKLLINIDANYLIDKGYLTKPKIMPIDIYGDDKKEIILEDIKKLTHTKTIIFTSNVTMAKEVAEELNAPCITSETRKKDRENILASDWNLLVNCSVLTTGFDEPAINKVIILRTTESAALFQQIIGRGLRLHPSKKHVEIYDYGNNIQYFGLQEDLFAPQIRNKTKEKFKIKCIHCEHEFVSKIRKKDYSVNINGYYIPYEFDRFGNEVESGYKIINIEDRKCPECNKYFETDIWCPNLECLALNKQKDINCHKCGDYLHQKTERNPDTWDKLLETRINELFPQIDLSGWHQVNSVEVTNTRSLKGVKYQKINWNNKFCTVHSKMWNNYIEYPEALTRIYIKKNKKGNYNVIEKC